MQPNDKMLQKMIERGQGFLAMTNDQEARDLLNALIELKAARKTLQQIANGEGYYGAQAREYKELAKGHFAAYPAF